MQRRWFACSSTGQTKRVAICRRCAARAATGATSEGGSARRRAVGALRRWVSSPRGDGDSAASDLARVRAPRRTGWRRSSTPMARCRSRGGIGTPGWTTPYALLLWHAVPGFEERESGARSLAARLQGQTLPRDEDNRRGDRPRCDGGRLAVGREHAFLGRADGAGHTGALPEGLHDHGASRPGFT